MLFGEIGILWFGVLVEISDWFEVGAVDKGNFFFPSGENSTRAGIGCLCRQNDAPGRGFGCFL